MSTGEAIASVVIIVILLYVLAILISLGVAVLQIISMWKLFEKAGEPNWSSIIPVYNYMQMIKIATGNYKLAWAYLIICGAYMVAAILMSVTSSFIEVFSDGSALLMGGMAILMTIVMVVSYLGLLVLAGYTAYMFSKAYGKSTTFCVLSIFFPPIMVIIMGLDKSTAYVGPKGIPQNNYY